MKRRYTDKEIGTLIQRATELQENAKASSEHSLSFEDIEHIAAEIGIDPTYLWRAAVELESETGTEKAFSITGAPFRIDMKRIVDGTLEQEQWEHLVQEVRRSTGSIGKTSTIGQTIEWSRSIDEIEHMHITFSPRGNETAIQVQKHYRGGALMAYVLAIIFSVTIAGIFLDGSGVSDVTLNAILATSMLTALIAARTALGHWSKHQRKKIKHLMDRLHEAMVQQESIEVEEQALVERPHLSEEEESAPNFAASRQRIKS